MHLVRDRMVRWSNSNGQEEEEAGSLKAKQKALLGGCTTSAIAKSKHLHIFKSINNQSLETDEPHNYSEVDAVKQTNTGCSHTVSFISSLADKTPLCRRQLAKLLFQTSLVFGKSIWLVGENVCLDLLQNGRHRRSAASGPRRSTASIK